TLERFPVPGELGDQVKPSLTLEYLRDGTSLGGGFDTILHILDVDSVTGGCITVYHDLQLWLPHEMIIVEVRYPANTSEHACNFFSFGLQQKQIRPVEFDRQLAFDAGERFIDVVFDRL